tara:strand:- start:84 stop:878 length:795 start_codon:yes stop_codon:yes gene_type:complete
MARNTISVKEVVNDFLLTLSEDDYVSNAQDYHVHQLALRGIREMGFDIMKRIKSLSLAVDSNNTVPLPDDFVDFLRVGIAGSNGIVHVLKENKNINISQEYVLDTFNNPIDSDGDGVNDRVNSARNSTSGNKVSDSATYMYEASEGRQYGAGGGSGVGYFRMNYEQNRLELNSDMDVDNIIVEYIADEARSQNPSVHLYAEEALRQYIYFKLVQRKANVPASEKQIARQNYYNELRLAKARMNSFSKEEALNVIRKNFRQSPKY